MKEFSRLGELVL